MAKRIIIEIDDQVLRCGEATTGVGGLQLGNLFLIELDHELELSKQAVAIKEALNANGIQRGEVDFIVNRRHVEMRELSVPPVPNDELADLLRFTAKSEFASVNDQWKLDFIPLSDVEDQARNILAAALAPNWLTAIDEIVKQCGFRLKRILLRPFCVVNAVNSHLDTDRPLLIVSHANGNLEMLLVNQRLLRANRSVLLSGHGSDELKQEIRGELTRTLMSGARIFGGRAIENVILLGDEDEWSETRKDLGEDVTVTIASHEKIFGDSISIAGHHPGGMIKDMAAVVGAARSLTTTNIPQVDFANPRKKKVREFDRKKAYLWSGVAAASLLILGILGWYMLSSTYIRIQAEEKKLSDLLKITEPTNGRPGVAQIIGEVGEIDQWENSNINWLNELAEVSKRVLSADEVILNSITLGTKDDSTSVGITCAVKSRDASTDMQSLLVARPYNVKPGMLTSDNKSADYPYSIPLSMLHSNDITLRKKEIENLARERQQKTSVEKTETPNPQ